MENIDTGIIKEKEEATASKKQVPRKPSMEYVALLRVRKIQKSKKPDFVRSESWRYKRVHSSWRRPKGIDNKMRLKLKDKPRNVEVGYRSPKLVRSFHPSGFEERLVFNVKELETIEPSNVVRIGHTVGSRKRLKIVEKAEELGLRILNARGVGVSEYKESKKTGV